MNHETIALLACQSGLKLGKRLFSEINANVLNTPKQAIKWIESDEVWFPNGEVKTVVKSCVTGMKVYVVQLFDDPGSQRTVNDNWMALLTAIDALYQSGAASVDVIIPQYPYSRQERAAKGEGITARQIALFLEASQVGHVLTVDIHQDSIAGFFRRSRLTSLSMIPSFLAQLNTDENWTLVSPDFGGTKRLCGFAEEKGYSVSFLDKQRDYTNQGTIKKMTLFGDVHQKNVLVIDDMIASGGTILKSCAIIQEAGAKTIHVATSFPFFNGKAIDRFDQAYEDGLIQGVCGTDAVSWSDEFKEPHAWYHEISVAPVIASNLI